MRKTKHPALHDASKQVRRVWGGLDRGAHRLANESTNVAGMKFHPKTKSISEMVAIGDLQEKEGPEIPIAKHP